MSFFASLAQMDSVTIGLWVTAFMMVFVIVGGRVAFAAAAAGFLGLVWVFSSRM